jgi:predicted nucleic acid-binding protein
MHALDYPNNYNLMHEQSSRRYPLQRWRLQKHSKKEQSTVQEFIPTLLEKQKIGSKQRNKQLFIMETAFTIRSEITFSFWQSLIWSAIATFI